MTPQMKVKDEGFDEFWQAYPKRVAKQDARKAWSKLTPTKELVAAMLEALEWQKAQPDWRKDGGQFVPYPASWLRGERWTDERPVEQQQPRGFDPERWARGQ